MIDLVEFFNEHFWATCVLLGGLTITISGYANNYFNPNKIWKQVISWIISLLLTIGSWAVGFITVSDPTWLSLICIGIVVGLSSNGVYSIDFIKNFVNNFTNFGKVIQTKISSSEKSEE